MIRILKADDRCVLRLGGELDVASSPSLRWQLKAARTEGARRVVVDLSGLEFIDSTGLHALIEAQQLCSEEQTELELVPGTPAVQRIFDLTQTSELFTFVPDRPPAALQR